MSASATTRVARPRAPGEPASSTTGAAPRPEGAVSPRARDSPRDAPLRALRPIAALAPLLGVFVGAYLVRAPGTAPVGDEGAFLSYAQHLLHGSYASPDTQNAIAFLWHGPGLPAFLTPLVALGAPLSVMRIVAGPLLLFAAMLWFYRLLRLRLRPRGALVGTYALGLYVPFWELLSFMHKEPLALVMVIAAMDGTARYLRGGARRHLLLGGLALAGLAMTRLEYGWVIAALLLVALLYWGASRRRTARRATLVCALAMIACLPWLAYTYDLTGQLFYWGNAGGLSLYWMSSPDPRQLGEWHAVHSVFSDPRLARYRPLFAHLQTLSPLHRDLQARHLAFAQALARPAKYALNLAANVSRMVFGAPFSFRLPPLVLGLLGLCNLLVLGAVARGVALAVRRRRRVEPVTIAFGLFALAGVGIHLFPSADPRMLMPLVPVLVWCAIDLGSDQRSVAERAAQRVGRIAGQHPVAIRAPAQQPALGELRQGGADRRPARADERSQPVVGERQRHDDALRGHPSPALGEVPEQEQQAGVDAV